jgi:predicted transcriptional regulator YheO
MAENNQTSPEEPYSGQDADADDERHNILNALQQVVEPLADTFQDCEIVVQDLAKLPNSIIAIAGDVTGRKINDPATDYLLQRVASGNLKTIRNYRSQLPNGKQIRSTTIFIKDSRGHEVAALCINLGLQQWQWLSQISATMLNGQLDDQLSDPSNNDKARETFVDNVDDLAELILTHAIARQKVPIELMTKAHKMEVIRNAKENGFFLIRDAADTIAARLHISRFTVYNYLKEIDTAKQ